MKYRDYCPENLMHLCSGKPATIEVILAAAKEISLLFNSYESPVDYLHYLGLGEEFKKNAFLDILAAAWLRYIGDIAYWDVDLRNRKAHEVAGILISSLGESVFPSVSLGIFDKGPDAVCHLRQNGKGPEDLFDNNGYVNKKYWGKIISNRQYDLHKTIQLIFTKFILHYLYNTDIKVQLFMDSQSISPWLPMI